MRILSFYATKTFKLILEFENKEYRILDMQKFLHNEQGLLKDICNDVDLFMSAELDEIAGTIRWRNGVDFDPTDVLYEASLDLDKLEDCQKKLPKPKKITKFPDDYQSKLSIENGQLIRLLRGN